MTLILEFKCSDAVRYALEDIADKNLRDEYYDMLSRYIKYGESVRLRFDTDTKTMEVLPIY